ncbi:MAG: fumarylacetoacetate hydrolase family protein [Bacteroidota bacterium]
MTNNPNIEAAAKRLRKAAETRVVCSPVRDLIDEYDEELAYKVQQINNDLRIKAGERVVGKKIGLTSKSVQAQFGISAPDFGLLFDTNEVLNGSEISIAEIMQPRVETEIAFILGKDLIDPSITAAEMLSAIDFALASIEIVGSRIKNWDIRITDTIADNASASHFVLGHKPVHLSNFDLINCKMAMQKNGEVVSEGKGSDCIGSPINAAIWLARKMTTLGDPLKAGDILLTGALGPMVPVDAGDHVSATIEGLGEVSVTFTD